MIATKVCTRCKVEKPLSGFGRHVAWKSGIAGHCRECDRAAGRDYYRRNKAKRLAYQKAYNQAHARKVADRKNESWNRKTPEEKKGRVLRWNFGITWEQYQTMLAAQGGGCAGCGEVNEAPNRKGGRRRWLAVDHDRACCAGVKSCGRCVRGLLCGRCNTAIGLLREDPAIFLRLLGYLAKHRRRLAREA